MTLAAGTKLGRYEIRSKIGEGGMGEVYLARDTQLGRIASGVLNSERRGGATAMVVVVEVDSGAERQITSRTWPPGSAGQVAWLADGSDLAFITFDSTTSSNQIWHISYPDGEVRKITNDLNNYSRLSVTADSSVLVTVQAEIAAGVWVRRKRTRAAPRRFIRAGMTGSRAWHGRPVDSCRSARCQQFRNFLTTVWHRK